MKALRSAQSQFVPSATLPNLSKRSLDRYESRFCNGSRTVEHVVQVELVNLVMRLFKLCDELFNIESLDARVRIVPQCM